MSDMKLLQFSTTWCGPCKMMRRYVENTFDAKKINYHFVDIERENEFSLIAKALQVRSVPVLVAIQGDNIIGMTKGADINFVNSYVEKFNAQENGDYLEEE